MGKDKQYIRFASKYIDTIAIITDLWGKSDFNFVKEHVFAHQDGLARPLYMLENRTAGLIP